MTKQELRTLYRTKRKSLTESEKSAFNHSICETVIRHFIADASAVHLFMPIDKNREPDLRPVAEYLWLHRPDIPVVTSVTPATGEHLEHKQILPETKWAINNYGIPEPVDAPDFRPARLSIVFVPLLALDRSGARVGYGKGYYDRFLADAPDAFRVGISFFPPEEEIADMGPHDIRLHACILPEAVCFFDTE